jgi:hypothetical protein
MRYHFKGSSALLVDLMESAESLGLLRVVPAAGEAESRCGRTFAV